MNTFTNIQEILDFAIAAKEQAIKFYLFLAADDENKEMKKTFTALANDVKTHVTKLRHIDIKNISFTDSNLISDLKVSDYTDPEVDYSTLKYSEVLVIAMNREKRTFMFYDKLSQMVDDDEIKKTFSYLAKKGNQHKNQFEIAYDDFVLVNN